MTDPAAHWSPSEIDDPDGDRASYPPPAPGVSALNDDAATILRSLARAELERLRDVRYHVGEDTPDSWAVARERDALWSVALGLIAERDRLRAELAAARPVLTLDAIRRSPAPVCCRVCSAEWPLDARDCPGCGHPDRDAGAVVDADHCPRCGALDLDHTCHAAAGERFAEEHPYAAGAIMGGIAHRSEVKRGQ